MTHPEFHRFVERIARLRAPDGCPWDREQTHRSIAKNLIEEAHETVAAIESGSTVDLLEELGDVLLQVVLQAQIAADAGEFTITDVIDAVDDKIVRRHPHVFGDVESAGEAAAVLAIWDKIKLDEKARKAADGRPEGMLDGIPRSLPALMQAQNISRKAVAAGFEWETFDDVWDKVHEEIAEFRECEPGSPEALEEMGDVLFTLVNIARKHHIDAESALRATCDKFRGRWSIMETLAGQRARRVDELSLEELESLWRIAKERENES